MNYFKYFPTIGYDQEGSTLTITNFTERAKIQERIRQNVTVFYDYIVRDGIRPDNVSQELYGSPLYTWIILLVNNIFTLFDWPLTSEEFANYITEKYGSVLAAQQQRIYTTVDGYIVDQDTFNTLTPDQQGVLKTAFDQEFDDNELKRRIKVVPPEFVVALTQELKRIL